MLSNVNCFLVYWYQIGAKNHSKAYNQWQIYIVKLWMRTILPVQLSIFRVVIGKFWQNNKLPTCLLFGIGAPPPPLPRLQKIWQFYQEIEFTETRIEISVAQWQIKHQQKICRSSYNEQKRLSSQFPAFQSKPFFSTQNPLLWLAGLKLRKTCSQYWSLITAGFPTDPPHHEKQWVLVDLSLNWQIFTAASNCDTNNRREDH